ncbi:MAG: preprotein translocase subunit YajC [Lachnospiraceae bacterium]|jgi:preprotein translocase subunit YajC|nr:preprotein translocase subunit YajC [Lachnospiraceae bacterium]
MNILLTGTETAYTSITMLITLVIMFVFFYFFISRPQKKEQKRMQSMLEALEIGDAICTQGGFYGIVIDITEDTVIVEFGNNKNCRIPMKKSAIAQVEKAEAN